MLTGWLLWAPAPGSVWPAERCAAAGQCSAAAASALGPRRQSGRSPLPTAAPEEHGPEHNDTHSIKKHLHTKGDSSSLLFIVPRFDTCCFQKEKFEQNSMNQYVLARSETWTHNRTDTLQVH